MRDTTVYAYLSSIIAFFINLSPEEWTKMFCAISITCAIFTCAYDIYHKHKIRRMLSKKRWINEED